MFLKGKVGRNKDLQLIDQITDMLTSKQIAFPEYDAILKNNGLTHFEFSKALARLSPRYAGQILNSLSQLERKLNAALGDKETSEIIGGLESGAKEVLASSWIKRLDNVRRGLMVTQLKNAVRNAETQIAKFTADIFVDFIDKSLQKIFTNKDVPSPVESFSKLLYLFQKNKKLTDEILKSYPEQYNKMFGIYAGEISKQSREAGIVPKGIDKVLTKLENATKVLNTANTFQEYLIRRASFISEMESKLNTIKMSLFDKEGFEKVINYEDIPFKIIKDSVEYSLETTFAKTPEHGTLAKKMIELINHPKLAFIATLPIPYPRFMYNSLKFTVEYSPVNFMRIALSPKQWAEIKQGNFREIGKATVGTALFLTAWQMRNSENAGEKWYEYKVGNKTYDLRPFNPFASHLFLADIVKRSKDGTLDKLSSKDIAMGILSTNMRAGTGVYILDQFINTLSQSGDADKLTQALKRLGGETIAGFSVPFAQLRDFATLFDENEKIVRDKTLSPFTAPSFSNIPGLSQTLPEYKSPVKEGTIKRENPALSQVTGLLAKEKTIVEKELDRLGFDYQEIFSKTGVPEFDYLVREKMGKLVDKNLTPILKSPIYTRRSDAKKGLFLSEELNKKEELATQMVIEDLKNKKNIVLLKKYIDAKNAKKPRRVRNVIKEIQAQP